MFAADEVDSFETVEAGGEDGLTVSGGGRGFDRGGVFGGPSVADRDGGLVDDQTGDFRLRSVETISRTRGQA